MKKVILSASLVLFLGLAAFAQEGTNNKKCQNKAENKECSKDTKCSKKCDPKDCVTGQACKGGNEKSCKHGSTTSINETKKDVAKK